MRPFALKVSVGVLLGATVVFGAQQHQERVVYFSAIDSKGTPIAGLSASDIVVTEDGRVRGPVEVVPATTPMRVAVILDDRGVGLPEVRMGLGSFVETLRGRADVGLFSTARAAVTLVDFTRDTATLLAGVEQLQATPGAIQTGAALSLPENRIAAGMGLQELTVELAHRFGQYGVARPVVLVVTIKPDRVNVPASLAAPVGANCGPANPGGTYGMSQDGCIQSGPMLLGGSGRGPEAAVKELQRSRTTLFAVAATNGRYQETPFLDRSAKVSGGHVESIQGHSAIAAAMSHVAAELLAQYALTYRAPPAPDQGSQLKLALKRRDVVVRAPERVGVR